MISTNVATSKLLNRKYADLPTSEKISESESKIKSQLSELKIDIAELNASRRWATSWSGLCYASRLEI